MDKYEVCLILQNAKQMLLEMLLIYIFGSLLEFKFRDFDQLDRYFIMRRQDLLSSAPLSTNEKRSAGSVDS